MDTANFITALIALGGLSLSIASFVSMRRLRRAEARNVEDEITERILNRANAETERQQKEIDDLNKRMSDMADLINTMEDELEDERKARRAAVERAEVAERKNTLYLNGIYILSQQLITNGHNPEWKPAETGPLNKVTP